MYIGMHGIMLCSFIRLDPSEVSSGGHFSSRSLTPFDMTNQEKTSSTPALE